LKTDFETETDSENRNMILRNHRV